MSEGPHRNLPMSPGWKRFAARVCNEAFNHEEVPDALVGGAGTGWAPREYGKPGPLSGRALSSLWVRHHFKAQWVERRDEHVPRGGECH